MYIELGGWRGEREKIMSANVFVSSRIDGNGQATYVQATYDSSKAEESFKIRPRRWIFKKLKNLHWY